MTTTLAPASDHGASRASERVKWFGRSERAPLTDKELLPAIDGFRGLATLIVVLTHVWLLSGSARLDQGWVQKLVAGGVVDFFFVISGFVLYLPAVYGKGRYPSIRSFAIRRAARILPLYYLSLVLVLALHAWITDPVENIRLPFESPESTVSLLMHLAFLQNFVLILHQEIGFGNGVVWTLPLEAVFYVLLPLIALRYYRRPFVMLGVAIAAAEVWKLAVRYLPLWLGWIGVSFPDLEATMRTQVSLMHAPTYFGQFALGMTAAWVFVRARQRHWDELGYRYAPWVQGVALVFIVAELLRQGADRIAGQPRMLHLQTTWLAFWFTVLVLATLMSPRWAQWAFANRFMRWTGTISYGIYVFHLLFIRFAVHTLGFSTDGSTAAFLAMLAFTFAGSLASGWVAHLLVERPVRRWAVKITRRPAAAPSPEPLPAVPAFETRVSEPV